MVNTQVNCSGVGKCTFHVYTDRLAAIPPPSKPAAFTNAWYHYEVPIRLEARLATHGELEIKGGWFIRFLFSLRRTLVVANRPASASLRNGWSKYQFSLASVVYGQIHSVWMVHKAVTRWITCNRDIFNIWCRPIPDKNLQTQTLADGISLSKIENTHDARNKQVRKEELG